MALVEDARPWWLSVKLGATNDKTVTKRYNLVATDHTEATTAATAVRTALAAVSAGKTVSYKIEQQFIEDTYARPTSQDAEWGEQAVISGKIDESPLEAWSQKIPFPVIGMFVDDEGKNRDVVKIDATIVTNYFDLFKPTTGSAYLSDGEFVGTLEEGRRL